MNANEIIFSDDNLAVLQTFFIGEVSAEYYDGLCYKLYLDKHDNALFICQEANCNTRMYRDDGSIVELHHISGYFNGEEEALYKEEDSLDDFGYYEWLKMIEDKIAGALE